MEGTKALFAKFGASFVAVLMLASFPARSADQAPIELLALEVPDTLKAGVPYTVTVPYVLHGEVDVRIVTACFTWSGEGPYCFKLRDKRDALQFTAQLKTGNPNTYRLEGFVKYEAGDNSGESNRVSTQIKVKP